MAPTTEQLSCGLSMPKGVYKTNPAHNWTEQQRLAVMLGVAYGLPSSTVAKRIGRTATAVDVFVKRNHLSRKHHGPHSGRDVARLLGVGCSKTVTRWVHNGWLKGHSRLRHGPTKMLSVLHDDLLTFLEDPRYWHVWQPERITDAALRQYTQALRTVTYLTPGQVAARFSVCAGAVNDWIHWDILPAKRYGNWRIAEHDVRNFTPPCMRKRQPKDQALSKNGEK